MSCSSLSVRTAEFAGVQDSNDAMRSVLMGMSTNERWTREKILRALISCSVNGH